MTSAEEWDRYFRDLRNSGGDLDWGGRWTAPFVDPFRQAGVRSVLELGCGTGNDAARLARAGFEVTATDLSSEAIGQAAEKFGDLASFSTLDMSLPLPFPDASHDAVMSNVALHRFSDAVTRSIFVEIARVLRPGGVFVGHVNAVEDRPLRARRFPVVRELEPDYVQESGGTMRFFSESYLRQLLHGWAEVSLDPVRIDDSAGDPFKHVWRIIAAR